MIPLLELDPTKNQLFHDFFSSVLVLVGRVTWYMLLVGGGRDPVNVGPNTTGNFFKKKKGRRVGGYEEERRKGRKTKLIF